MEEKIAKNKQKNDDHLKYWVAYSKILKIGPVDFKKLVDYFVDMKLAWEAGSAELIKTGINRELVSEIISARTQINPSNELEKLKKENISAVLITDDNYPKLLKEISDPPPILYFRGSLDFLANNCIAVVGTRKFTPYGRQVTEDLVAGLVRNGITIISGLALGIDAIAHKACLEANGKTIGILGSAVNPQCFYPSSNRHIGDKIIESGGAIASEYPIGTMPTKFTFPMRNRIVSGLSLGVLVIEAPERSGALITSKCALDQNRDVFAVPGNIYSRNAKGVNELIKNGAKPVASIEDILEELNIQTVLDLPQNKQKFDNEDEKIISELLSKEPTHIDKIKNSSKLNINVLLGTITMMEIKGIIKDIGGKNYILT